MTDKKEFLTEENYEKGKKKLKTIALIVLMVGILLGGSLIVAGIVKSKGVKEKNAETAQQIEDKNKARTAEEIKADIENVEAQIEAKDVEIKQLENEKSKLRTEQEKIFQSDRGFSDRYYAKDEEIDAKQDEIDEAKKEKTKLQSLLSSYENELWKVESGYNDTKVKIDKAHNLISAEQYILLYMLGGFIIAVSCMISFSIYMFIKRREILAFTAQQVMPVAQEGIEKMAPSVGKAGASIAKEMSPVYGDIAKNIVKGIKEGKKEDGEKE